MKFFPNVVDNKLGMYRAISVISVLALLLCSIKPESVNGVFVPDTDLGQGVIGFLRSLEITMERKTAWFYRYFGQNVDPAKINQVRLCDYSDPAKVKYCSPVFNPRAPKQNPNISSGSNANSALLLKKNRASFKSIPSKCFDDPDDPDCRKLRTLTGNALPGISQVSQSKSSSDDSEDDAEAPAPTPNTNHSFMTQPPSAPSGATASFSPTRYMCYGNHDSFKTAGSAGDEQFNVRGKWCESSMPSVSLEPSASPVIYPEGYQDGDGTPTTPTPKPSAVFEDPSSTPSEEPTVGGTAPWEGPPGLEYKNPAESVAPSPSPSASPSGGPTAGPVPAPVEIPKLDSPTTGSKAKVGVKSNVAVGSAVIPPSGQPVGGPVLAPVEIPKLDSPTTSRVKQPDGVQAEVSVGSAIIPSSEEPTGQPVDIPFTGPPQGQPVMSGPPQGQPVTPPINQPASPPNSVPVVPPTSAPFVIPPTPLTSQEPNASPVVQQPSEAPDAPTDAPTKSPSASPSTYEPTGSIEEISSPGPTDPPTSSPSDPSSAPSGGPSSDPSASPSGGPSASPSEGPSGGPSASPSLAPSSSPSESPSSAPSASPSDMPSTLPSESPSGSFYPSSAPSDSPTDSSEPSVSPSSSPTLTCEAEFIRFNEDGSGIPTDLLSCVNEDEEILLPRKLSLFSASGSVVGTLDVNFTCMATDASEWVVTLKLDDDHTVTGDSSVSILTLNEKVLAEITSIEAFEDNSGWIARVPLAMSRQGKVLIDIVTEVDGEVSTLTTGDDFVEACFDCGGGAAYFADPNGFLEDGFRVNAYSDDDAHTTGLDAARYMHTQLHDLYEDFDSTFVNDDVDTCLIIQENNTLTPYANTGGGKITFNFTDTTDELFEFELFNIHVRATVFAFSDGVVYEYSVGPAINEVQNVVVDVPNVEYVEIQFEGPGAVCGIKSCLDGTRAPSPGQELPPSFTIAPTVSPVPSSTPSDSPSISVYPSSAPSDSPTESAQPTNCYDLYGVTEEDIINQIGSEEPIPKDAVKIINGENANVTIGKYHFVSVPAHIIWLLFRKQILSLFVPRLHFFSTFTPLLLF